MTQRKTLLFLIFLVCTILTRVVYLGNLPEGLSSLEVGFGTILAKYFGIGTNLPFIIRIPFALVGTLTAVVFYKLVLIKTKDFKFALTSALFFAFTPWSISENRILSWGSMISFAIVSAAYFFRNTRFDKRVWFYLATIFTVFFLSVSVLIIPRNTKEKVHFRRNIAYESTPKTVSNLMVNKYVESIHTSSGIFLANFDFGNYFFGGSPRQRWGIEETQKLLPVLLPLFLLGIIKSKKEENGFYLSISIAYIAFLTAFKLVDPTFGLPLLFVFSLLIAKGLLSLSKVIRFAFLIIFIFELTMYLSSYVSGKTENMFSPRSVENTIKLK